MRLAPYFLGVLASLACGCAARPSIALKRYQFTRPRMGVPFRVVFWADNDARAKVDAHMQEETSKMMGGVELPPGFKMPF